MDFGLEIFWSEIMRYAECNYHVKGKSVTFMHLDQISVWICRDVRVCAYK